jgi:hypothetical protein
MKALSEPVRALGWHLAITALAVGALCAIFMFGVIAVLNFGTGLGLGATLVLAIIAIGVASWLLSDKGRPQA